MIVSRTVMVEVMVVEVVEGKGTFLESRVTLFAG